MEVKATAKGVRVSPKKVRCIIDMVRGRQAEEALAILNFMPGPTARAVSKIVKSAISNAENNFHMIPSDLRVVKAFVDEGTTMRRVRFGGRATVKPIRKRSSHITVVVEER